MIWAIAEIMMRAVTFPEDDYRAELSVTPVCKEVDTRFCVPFLRSGTVQKPVEHLRRRLCSLGLDHENSGSEFFVVVQAGILHFSQVGKLCRVNIVLKRHQSFRDTLEVVMVRSRCSTARTVVEESTVGIFPGQIEDIHIPVPYRLVGMAAHGNDQMFREDRVWIDKDMIFLAFAALELHHYLLCRTVFPTEETFATGDVFLGQFCCRGDHSRRIELKFHLQSAYFHLAYTDILQSPEVVARERPSRKLVTDEFMYS